MAEVGVVTRIAVLGEALVDLLPGPDRTYIGHAGGSPANAAVAMARLGLDVTFLGGLSSDTWGTFLAQHLAANGVDTPVVGIDAPTTLAVADVGDGGVVTYRFLWDDTADLQVTTADLPADLGDTAALLVGSVDAVRGPVSDAVRDLVIREHERRVVVLDPNIRADIIGDVEDAQARLLELASFAHIVKASDEDLAILLPDLDPDEAAFQLLDGEATQLVVVTRGAKGAWVTTPRFQVPLPAAVADTVVDTVAAGDTFTAGLITWLAEHDLLRAGPLRTLNSEAASAAGRFAAEAAAIVVGRVGADPPHRHELPEAADRR